MAHRPTTPLATPAGTHASHLALVFGFTTLYLVAEVVGGLVLALLAIRFAARPATPARTYGYYRFEILAALMNSIVLMGIPVYMLYEAYQRFRHPPAVWRACTSASRVISRSHTPQCKWNHRVMGSTKRTSRPCRPVLLASVTGPQKEGATMTSLWLWPILFFLAPAQASLMRPESGGGCSPTSTSVPPSVTIACQGVDPQVLQPLNAMLATTDQDLHSNIRQAEAWVRTAETMASSRKRTSWSRPGSSRTPAHSSTGCSRRRTRRHPSGWPPTTSAVRNCSPCHSSSVKHCPTMPQRRVCTRPLPSMPIAMPSSYSSRASIRMRNRSTGPPSRPCVPWSALIPPVALALDSLASLYHALQRFPEAEAVYQEAVTTYRQLAQTQSATYLPEVAAMLHNVGVFYSSTRRFAEAEAAYQEALTIHRQLAQTYPAASLPDIATTLTNLGVLYDRTQRLPKAEAAYQEALTLRQRLAQTNPTGALSDVAATLTSLARLALAQQRSQPAMEWIREAVTIHRTLWQHDPAMYGDALAQSVALEAVTLKRTAAATPVVETSSGCESLGVYRATPEDPVYSCRYRSEQGLARRKMQGAST
jgi:tetratricopeptide (TPR) repeat protein